MSELGVNGKEMCQYSFFLIQKCVCQGDELQNMVDGDSHIYDILMNNATFTLTGF